MGLCRSPTGSGIVVTEIFQEVRGHRVGRLSLRHSGPSRPPWPERSAPEILACRMPSGRGAAVRSCGETATGRQQMARLRLRVFIEASWKPRRSHGRSGLLARASALLSCRGARIGRRLDERRGRIEERVDTVEPWPFRMRPAPPYQTGQAFREVNGLTRGGRHQIKTAHNSVCRKSIRNFLKPVSALSLSVSQIKKV